MLSSCSTKEYVAVPYVVSPPETLYKPKPPPQSPVKQGERMTVRQSIQWLSDFITWSGEVCADREAIGQIIEKAKAVIEEKK